MPNAITDAAEDKTENESEQVRQAAQDAGFGQIKFENFAHEFWSCCDEEEQTPNISKVKNQKSVELRAH